MSKLSDKLVQIKPEFHKDHCAYIHRASFDLMRAVAIELSKALEELEKPYLALPLKTPRFKDEIIKEALDRCTEILNNE